MNSVDVVWRAAVDFPTICQSVKYASHSLSQCMVADWQMPLLLRVSFHAACVYVCVSVSRCYSLCLGRTVFVLNKTFLFSRSFFCCCCFGLFPFFFDRKTLLQGFSCTFGKSSWFFLVSSFPTHENTNMLSVFCPEMENSLVSFGRKTSWLAFIMSFSNLILWPYKLNNERDEPTKQETKRQTLFDENCSSRFR